MFAVDPKDPTIEYKWFDVGMLGYDEKASRYLVQKINAQHRIIDNQGTPIINGGVRNDGK